MRSLTPFYPKIRAIKLQKSATEKAKQSFEDNDGHNILRVFDTLPIFCFTTSETKRDYQ